MFTSEVFTNALSISLFILRVLVPVFCIVVLVQCYISLRRSRRKDAPVVFLEDVASGVAIPVLYWENSLGRSKSCDIVLPSDTVSRDHAVLMRRESGWIITDTGSKSGTYINTIKSKAYPHCARRYHLLRCFVLYTPSCRRSRRNRCTRIENKKN